MDWIRMFAIILILTNMALIWYISHHWMMFRPIGWVWMFWMGHALFYFVFTILDLDYWHILSNTQINIWSSALRLHGFGSLLSALIIIALYIRGQPK